MPIIKNAQVHYLRANPRRPNDKYDKQNPTWEVEIRTTDKNQKAEWAAMGLNIKAVMPDDGAPYWRAKIKKRTIKADGEKADPVEVVSGKLIPADQGGDGRKFEPVDPDTIGNGSICNVRIFQYEYPKKEGGKGIANVLMGLQVVRHILYKPKSRDNGFEATDTEVVKPEGYDDDSAETQQEPSPNVGGHADSEY